MTNIEYFAQNPMELAILIDKSNGNLGCKSCPAKPYCDSLNGIETPESCQEIIKDWLNQERNSNEDKLSKIKEIIAKYFAEADGGIYDTRSISGDVTTNIYKDEKNGITIDICYYYGYFEVFGLNGREFEEIKNYYDSLRTKKFTKAEIT